MAQRKDADGRLALDVEGRPVPVAEQRLIETGERRDGQVVIATGLSKGEQIVTAGQLKLAHGARISVSIDRTLAADYQRQAGAGSIEE